MEAGASTAVSRGSADARQNHKRKRDTSEKSTPSKNSRGPRRSAAAQTSSEDTSTGFNLEAIRDHNSSHSLPRSNGNSPEISNKNNLDTAAAAAALSQYSMNATGQADSSFLNQSTSEGPFSGGEVDANDPLSTLEGPGSSGRSIRNPPPRDQSSSPDPGPVEPQLYAAMRGIYLPKHRVGSKAYEAQRKANHKEVERRRRETINEGINELAKLVPDTSNSKSHVLIKASMYIQKLQEDANANIDKWTFEKLITEQAISEMSAKLGQAWQEKNVWKQKAKDAGVDVAAVEAEMRKGLNKGASDEADSRQAGEGQEPHEHAKAKRNSDPKGKGKATEAPADEEESESSSSEEDEREEEE